jgi:hypothetical protein
MPSYRVFYLKERQITGYRQGTPRPQPYHLKPSDYEEGPAIEAPSPYAVWKLLEERTEKYPGARKMVVGDVLQTEGSPIVVMNFWGFDEATWREAEPAGLPASGVKGEGAAGSEDGAEVESRTSKS